MNQTDELKQIVKEKYSQIASQDKHTNASSCCGSGPTSNKVYNVMMDDYTHIEGYNPEADLGLGCGLPTEFAKIEKGDIVVDLGSGAGNDCFVARHEVGPTGKVIGIDFSGEMIEKARINADQLQLNNVEFRLGDIDKMPVADNSADVVISNCVLNLVPDKMRVFSEMQRVLIPGGHFSVSDIVLVGELPEALQKQAELYAGCVSGAIQKQDYLDFLQAVGFENIQVQKEKTITLPDDILSTYMSKEEMDAYKAGKTGIFSITVYGEKTNKSFDKLIFEEMSHNHSGGACCGSGGGGCGC